MEYFRQLGNDKKHYIYKWKKNYFRFLFHNEIVPEEHVFSLAIMRYIDGSSIVLSVSNCGKIYKKESFVRSSLLSENNLKDKKIMELNDKTARILKRILNTKLTIDKTIIFKKFYYLKGKYEFN